MSLNGLDASPVLEAHEAVAAEPGGWFLLKYASRDEVELLSRGNGGIVEVRKTIAEYDETSPLYGFLRYRRRNVVIKYLPEGCSRLIQARVAVHFNAVCERFSPYDTTFEIAQSDELKDSKLSAACSLHAASGSNASSSSSLRRRRLMEIAEEEEEEPRAAKRKSTVLEDGDDEDRPKSPAAPAEPVTLNSDLATSPEHTKFSAATTSEVLNFVGVDETPTSPVEAPRMSSQSARPDLFSYSSYPYSKPRVKLGPRPSADANIRPQTAGNFQPVSSIPAGVKLFGKGHRKARSRENSEAAAPVSVSVVPDLPAASLQTPVNGEAPPRPGTSSGLSTASTIMPSTNAATSSSPPAKQTITPEKARLMRAMQLREKKKLKMVNEASSSLSPALDSPTLAKDDSEPQKDSEKPAQDTTDQLAAGTDDIAAKEGEPQEPSSNETESEVKETELTVAKRLTMVKADSGVVLENFSSISNDQASEQTLSDSRSQSPVLASSEPDQSTKASSVSGSTDETVHAKEEEAGDEEPQEEPQTSPDTILAGEVETHSQELEQQDTASNKQASETNSELSNVEQPVEPVQHEQTTQEVIQDKQVNESASVPLKVEESIDASQHQQSAAPQPAEEAKHEPETGEIIIQLPIEERPHAQGVSNKNSKSPLTVKTTEISDNQEPGAHDFHNDDNHPPPTTPPPEQPRKITVPISKFSANGTKTRSPQETRPTVEIPPTSARTASTTTTPTNEVSSPQRGSPRSKLSTQDLRAAAKAAAQTTLPPPLPQSLQANEPDAAIEEAVVTEDEPTPQEDPIPQAETPIIKEDFASEQSVPAPDKEDTVMDKDEFADDEEDALDTGVNTEDGTSTYTPNDDSREQPLKPPILSILTERPPHSRQISRSGTETHLSEDEELMDELQSATVQEATPITVAKTPVSPVFPTSVKGPPPSPGHLVRTVSNPLRAPLLMPTDVNQSSARSVSSGAAYLHKITQQQTNGNLARKGTVGSSISQRIKALERLSVPAADVVAGPTRTSRERPQSTFFSVKKSREPSKSPSMVNKASSFTRQASTPSSRDHSPDVNKANQRDRSLSVASRLSMFESPPRSNTASQSPSNTPRGRPESVSVTAKIVRDPNQTVQKSLEPPKDPSEFAPLDLKQSPLVVDHRKAEPEEQAALDIAVVDSVADRRMSRESHRSEFQEPKETKRRSSLTIVRDFIKERRKSVTSNTDPVSPTHSGPGASFSSWPPSAHHNHTIGSRLSISSRRSLSKDRDNGISPTGMTESSVSGDESKSSSSDKKKSRTGRFMRRLSELSSSRGKVASPHVISPAVAEEEIPEPTVAPRPSTTNTPAIVADMGDVNVQFPDNLLWKRRNMRLDAQGFLMLNAPPGAAGARALAQGTKRYHLSDFRPPYTPDVEVQELPNSVVLDLIEGSGVQIACEDRAGQMHVLHTLQEAHAAHAAAFGR